MGSIRVATTPLSSILLDNCNQKSINILSHGLLNRLAGSEFDQFEHPLLMHRLHSIMEANQLGNDITIKYLRSSNILRLGSTQK